MTFVGIITFLPIIEVFNVRDVFFFLFKNDVNT